MSQKASREIRWEQLERVLPRVGTDPLDRLQWALDFSKNDLGALTPGDWDNLRLELAAFSLPHVGVEARDSLFEMMGDEKILLLQEEIRELLADLYSLGFAYIQVSSIVHLVTRRRLPPKEQAPFNLRGRILQKLAELLMSFGDLLETCPECQRWFMRGRKNQIYCGPQCQTRVNTRIYRGNQIFQEVAARGPTVDEKKQILKFSPQEVREFAEKVRRQQPKPRRKRPRRKGGR